MSQSPLEFGGQGQDDYINAWRALYAQVEAGSSWSGRERNRCFLNVGSGRFANTSAVSGIDFEDDARGLALVDWDQDGDLDVWFANRSGPTLRFLSNNGLPTNNWLQLKLVGTAANRDAIGARIEVLRSGDDQSRIINTLRAENGFRTQPTKWVHLGLGDAKGIERLTVRWPGGEEEEFQGTSLNQRFVLEQGTATARRYESELQPIELAPAPVPEPEATEQARIILASRVPVPGLQYESEDGRLHELRATGEKPLLVTLWASWCPVCMKELRDFTKGEAELRQSGLNVLALNVDHLSDAGMSEANDAKAAIESIGFPFDAALATDELFSKLTLLAQHIVPRRQPLPAPCSFLIDPQGWLVAIYKGPVGLEQLQNDTAMAFLDRRQVRDLGIPFRGQWLFPRTYANLNGLAKSFREKGYEEDYFRFRHAEIGMFAEVPFPAEQQRAAKIARDLAIDYNERSNELAKEGKLGEAVASLQEAVRLDPNFAEGYNNLGTMLSGLGRLDEAVRYFQKALEIRPDFVDASRNLQAVVELIERNK